MDPLSFKILILSILTLLLPHEKCALAEGFPILSTGEIRRALTHHQVNMVKQRVRLYLDPFRQATASSKSLPIIVDYQPELIPLDSKSEGASEDQKNNEEKKNPEEDKLNRLSDDDYILVPTQKQSLSEVMEEEDLKINFKESILFNITEEDIQRKIEEQRINTLKESAYQNCLQEKTACQGSPCTDVVTWEAKTSSELDHPAHRDIAYYFTQIYCTNHSQTPVSRRGGNRLAAEIVKMDENLLAEYEKVIHTLHGVSKNSCIHPGAQTAHSAILNSSNEETDPLKGDVYFAYLINSAITTMRLKDVPKLRVRLQAKPPQMPPVPYSRIL